MKKRTRLLYGLLLLCAPLAGCLKEDDGSQFYSDVYWFPLAKQTFSVDTREPEPVDTVVLVFRARNFVYDSDTVNFAVMPDSTTAVAGTDYEITTPVVRFGKDDYYDNLLRGERDGRRSDNRLSKPRRSGQWRFLLSCRRIDATIRSAGKRGSGVLRRILPDPQACLWGEAGI